MPYIDRQLRTDATCAQPTTPGELNYAITMLLMRYLDDKPHSYQTINDALGALVGAKLEFYRRVAALYEDEKLEENGDVY